MNKDIQALIEREANDHKDQTDYIASQEYICGCSNENDKLFCWDASTACSIQARESFQAGASFALSLFKWRKVSEELPEEDESLLIETTKKSYKGKMEKIGVIKTKEVLVKYANGEVILSQRCQCKGDIYFWWNCRESFNINDPYFITEWMPIPQID